MPIHFGYIPRSGFYFRTSKRTSKGETKQKFLALPMPSRSYFKKKVRSVIPYQSRKRKSYNGRPRRRRTGVKRASVRVSANSKAISKLQKKLNKRTSQLIYRSIDDARPNTGNQQAYNGKIAANLTGIQSALAQVKMFDPSTPGTLITADFSSGTYQRDITIQASAFQHFRNNSTVSVELHCYVYSVKDDTGQSVGSAWDAGLADMSNVASSSQLVRPEDVPLVSDLWTKKRRKVIRLEPGRSYRHYWSEKPFSFDPATADVDTEEYQKKFRTFELFTVLRAPIAHDSTTTSLVSYQGITCDIVEGVEYKIFYNSGGPALKYIYGVDTTGTVTSAVYGNKPVADVQARETI